MKIGEFLTGFKNKLETDPQFNQAVLVAAGQLLQSPRPGENALDPVGRALQGGVGYLRMLREQEAAKRAQAEKEARSYELDKQRTDLYGEQVRGTNEASRRRDENEDLLRQQQKEESGLDRASRERIAAMGAGATVKAAETRATADKTENEPKIFGVPKSVFDRQVATYAKLYNKPLDVAEFEMFQQALTKLTPQAIETRLSVPTAGYPAGFPVQDPAAAAARINNPQYPGLPQTQSKPALQVGQKGMFTLPGFRDPQPGVVVQLPDGSVGVEINGKQYKVN